MKKLIILAVVLMPLWAMAHNFTLLNGEITWNKKIEGKLNTTMLVNLQNGDSIISGQLANYTVNYEAQGIEWRYLPVMLNDPLFSTVVITPGADSTYNVTVKDLTFRISDRNRGPVGQVYDLEYYMINKNKLTKDPEYLDILNILSTDFEKLFKQ